MLVHGAAGGVGTAALQVAKGLGARTIAVVSSDEKERVAREAGADEVVRSDGAWKDEAKELSGGGVDLVLDPVGGDRFTDSLRSLREGGRVVVVGFTGGSIPEVKVNRLLLNNTEVIGAGWGAYVMAKPEVNREIGAALDELIAAGARARRSSARASRSTAAAEALKLIDGRGALGKVVLDVRERLATPRRASAAVLGRPACRRRRAAPARAGLRRGSSSAGMTASAMIARAHQNVWPNASAIVGATVAARRRRDATARRRARPRRRRAGGSASWWVSTTDSSAVPIEPPTRWMMFSAVVARAICWRCSVW